jgi:predicted metal-dependent enzyme (double-stranded beta helix superfamily)
MAHMCDLEQRHAHQAFGFLVDTPVIRTLVDETQRLIATIPDTSVRVEALKPAFARLLAADGWLPDVYALPDFTSGMGSGIGQYALYRAEDGSLTLFSLVIPAGAETPVHDHLAWGLVGVYRGLQHETVYRRLDAGQEETKAVLEVSRTRTMGTGEFYSLIPPLDDIHYVKTVSDESSVSIHLLANDTACVWRHRFEPHTGEVRAFRSGYSNAPCPPERAAGDSAATSSTDAR